MDDSKQYILQVSPRCFIQKADDGEILLVPYLDKAKKYERIGDAMKVAAHINEIFKYPLTTVIEDY